MKKLIDTAIPRRDFIGSASFLLMGSRLSGLFPLSDYTGRIFQTFSEELSPEELKKVEKSVMAQDLQNYFGQGYSCAEALFMVSLRFLKKPEDHVWMAAGFGGGMYHKDLCGFLTAGIMAIGVSVGMLNKERNDAKEIGSQKVKEYWTWWTSQAPLHCSEIRTEGTSSNVCQRLGQIAAVKIEGLIRG